MCEYCGCQDLTAIDQLTREHDLVVNLIGDVRAANAATDVTLMAELGRQIASVLGPHTEVEEHGLFPALAADFPDHIASLAGEHRRIERVLGEAAGGGTPTDRTWPRRLVETLDVLREHILKEQDGVFPAALANLSTADWDAVDAVRSRVGPQLITGGHSTDERTRPAAGEVGPPGSRRRKPGAFAIGATYPW